MSYSKLPVHLDNLDEIVPRFTASQLVRALLIVIGEDSRIKGDDIDPRVFLCVGCMNRSVAGERVMSFAWPDPEASEEDRLIKMLRRIMYPHRPESPILAHTCACTTHTDGSQEASGSRSAVSVSAEDMSDDVHDGPDLPYPETAVAPAPVPAPATEPIPAAAAEPVPMLAPRPVPFIAAPSHATSWYVVAVGRRVGVFDNSGIVSAITDGVPANSRKCYSSRAAAIQAFEELWETPGCVRTVDI